MTFGEIPLEEAEGALLAHSLRQGGLSFKKGRRLSAEDVAALREAGLERVVAARLEPGDLHEDAAAARIAEALAGPAGESGTKITAAFTGRCNLVAEARGLFLVDPARIAAVNALDEAITVATLPAFEPVEPRQMLATVKIIPFAAPAEAVERAVALLADGRNAPALQVAAFRARKVGLVQTALPGTKPALLDKGRAALDARLAALGCPPALERRVGHAADEIAAAVAALKAEGCQLLLVSGASAIVDRRDVVPAGIEAAGGRLLHFGMPVDPGNLLLLAELEGAPVLGLPGCARAPKINGFDWVLQRLVADLAVTPSDIAGLGVGGLLKEIGGRPLPRAEAVRGAEEAAEAAGESGAKRQPRIAALVLAAGQGRRMGGPNKLLLPYRGEPLLRAAVRAAQESDAAEVLVVTGHERQAVEAALEGLGVRTLHNPDYAEGLSTSLKAGLAGLPAEVDGVVVLLGDMPQVGAGVIDRLIAAFDPLEGRAICQPSWHGKRGNPVLFARRFFAEVQALGGDVGAKPLLADYPELVCEVPVEAEAVLSDVDTPAAYRALTAE
ncbi:MAG: molybdopterin-binding/glycosyltransferase family 2 protein [Tistlia sp.]|uniref:NTP transferase domain-containing protein n=1 Tax=Tistlia sp. TaxID=3057121 RepID=UPI0034A25803